MVKPNGKFWSWNDLKERGLKSNNFLDWFALINALPPDWSKSILAINSYDLEEPVTKRNLKVKFNSKEIDIDKTNSKFFYKILTSSLHQKPTAQDRYNVLFSNLTLNWKEIYALPFKVALDTSTREFQYKILHRIVSTNVRLKKFGYSDSSTCSFCLEEEETLEHLFCHLCTKLLVKSERMVGKM